MTSAFKLHLLSFKVVNNLFLDTYPHDGVFWQAVDLTNFVVSNAATYVAY